jgi:hypothetical protein
MEAKETGQVVAITARRAKLTALEGTGAEADIEVRQSASRLLTACSDRAWPAGMPVRIDQADSLMLGEVAACHEEEPGRFDLLIELDESLSGLQSLRQLVRALMGEGRDGDPSHPLQAPPHPARPIARPRAR